MRKFLPVILTILVVGNTWAFKPGPIIIRECPKCNVQLNQYTTMSGNTIGARFWTDGKMEAIMLPDRQLLVKCPKCGKLLWIDEAKEIGIFTLKASIVKGQLVWEENKWSSAVNPYIPSETDFLSVLSERNLTKKKELYVRKKAWWAANDAVRINAKTTFKFSLSQEKNLKALANILDEKDADKRITKAEIFRELGMFQECIKLLAKPFDNDRHTEVAAVIRKLAERKIRIVSEIIYNGANK